MLRFYVHRVYEKIKFTTRKLLILPKVGKQILTKCYREKFSVGSQIGTGSNKASVSDFRFRPRSTRDLRSSGM